MQMRTGQREGLMDLGPDPIDIEVGNRMRGRRNILRMSQGVLADALGVSFQQVQKYERGANRVSASMLVKAAKALGTTVGHLVGEEGVTPIIEGDSELSSYLASRHMTDLASRIVDMEPPQRQKIVDGMHNLLDAVEIGQGKTPTKRPRFDPRQLQA